MNTVSVLVRDLRLARGWNAEELGEAASVPADRVLGLEDGTADPTIGELRRVAEALGTDLARLLGSLLLTHKPAAALPSARSMLHFGETRRNAEGLLRDPRAVRKIVEQATTLAADPAAARLGDVRQDLLTLVELLDAYGEGEYRSVPWEGMVLIAAALLYFVSPQDIVPDYLAEGYIDDAAVIAFVTEMVGPDLDAFLGTDQT